MKTICCFCLVLTGLFALSLGASAQTTIFSGLNPVHSWGVGPLNGQIGEEATVADGNWQVTSLQIEIYSQGGIFPAGTPGFANFQASLYANNGAQGAPGSLLWQSVLVPDNYPGGLSLLTFNVPEVTVPNQFTWTLYYTNDNPNIPPALPVTSVPTIGVYDTGCFNSPGSAWGQVNPEDGEGFMAQIVGVPVPEPGTNILLLAGTVMLWILSTHRRRKLKTMRQREG